MQLISIFKYFEFGGICMSILVTGGAGYIGSHTVAQLVENGEDVVILDNLEKGHRDAILDGKLLVGDIRDDDFLEKVFNDNDIESVIHFAAYSLVGQSMTDPIYYYNNNLLSTMRLLEKMKKYKVNKIVFSSTAATYGQPKNIPILETDDTTPTNPYGESKLAIEKLLKWCDQAYGIKYISLRYFNAAGAYVGGIIGEDHTPETHLIPLVLQTALEKRKSIQIFGDDYETKDGTCLRDYIHVSDLADAHILALEKLRNNGESSIYNLGNGNGFSVKEIISISEKVTGKTINKEIVARRPGDPAILVASSDKIKKELGWKPRYSSIEKIIQTAWQWHKNHPDGYTE